MNKGAVPARRHKRIYIMKIFVVNWATCHDGYVESGSCVFPTKEGAIDKLDELYKQSCRQMVTGYRDKTLKSYYVEEKDNKQNWERAELSETTILGNSVPVVTVSDSDLKELGIASDVSYRQLEEVAALMEQMYSNDFKENLRQAWDVVSKRKHLPVEKSNLREVMSKNKETALKALEIYGKPMPLNVTVVIDNNGCVSFALVIEAKPYGTNNIELTVVDDETDEKEIAYIGSMSDEDENRVLCDIIDEYNKWIRG